MVSFSSLPQEMIQFDSHLPDGKPPTCWNKCHIVSISTCWSIASIHRLICVWILRHKNLPIPFLLAVNDESTWFAEQKYLKNLEPSPWSIENMWGLIAQQVAQVRNYLHSLLGWYGSILRIFNNCLCQHGDVAVHTLENVPSLKLTWH